MLNSDRLPKEDDFFIDTSISSLYATYTSHEKCKCMSVLCMVMSTLKTSIYKMKIRNSKRYNQLIE
ncbi:hypothetical protein GCM10007931_09490 [Vibrio algivorus]|uniref:Uncharacterized protein n=1 Tax=Vibrio algivorus TaxID=1667024 RepID=A0ABQ6ELK7_9VIBR|nr:hypothetical protein GCM10007931_09490 [Vibrio algivorus]